MNLGFIGTGKIASSIIYGIFKSKLKINKIYISAWKLGLKSLYYQHSMNAAQQFKQKKECTTCEA